MTRDMNTVKMSYEEMIDTLKGLVFGTFDRTTVKEREALDMAIKALEQETVSRESYDHEYFLRKELSLKVYKLDRILEQADLALDDIKATLRSPNRDDMVDKIEKIVNKYDENVIKFLNSIS